MPRRERPLDPAADPVHAFAADLRRLRAEAGDPKYLQMARLSGRSRTALSEAAGGDHLPTWETTEAFVKACGGDAGTWRLKWERTQEKVSGSTRLIPLAPRPEPEDPPRHPAGPRPPHTTADADVLLRMWQEQRTQGRQSENHRAIMTLLVVIGAVGGLSYVALKGDSGPISAGVAFGVCALGLFGALISAKYFERFKMHMDAAQLLRRRLSDMYPELCLEDDWAANRRRHENNYQILSRIRLEHLWVIAHLGIAILGIVVTVTVLADL
ncbi:helix-turn-helix domain-containing protein [Nocardia beijingensis]|uniref:Helix-turn-helix domain-containing protein n=1 Tax=Nocardia beijingensis TaxID=95162 RepID=A0ABW7W7C7_9NOCA